MWITRRVIQASAGRRSVLALWLAPEAGGFELGQGRDLL